MQLDEMTAELIADFVRVLTRAKEHTGFENHKPLREFIFFYVERQFFNKETMKRTYATELPPLKWSILRYGFQGGPLQRGQLRPE